MAARAGQSRARQGGGKSGGECAATRLTLPRSTASIGQRVLAIGIVLVVLAAFAAGTVEQRWKEAQLRSQIAVRQADLATLQRRNMELRARLATSDPSAYRAWVEDTARRQLNLGYPGETVVLVNWTDPPGGTTAAETPTPGPAPTPSAEPNWKRWLRLLRGE